jgi:hypothetical protein
VADSEGCETCGSDDPAKDRYLSPNRVYGQVRRGALRVWPTGERAQPCPDSFHASPPPETPTDEAESLYCSVCGERREPDEAAFVCRKGGESIPHDDPSQGTEPCSTEEERAEERWLLFRDVDDDGTKSQWYLAPGDGAARRRFAAKTPDRYELVEVIRSTWDDS